MRILLPYDGSAHSQAAVDFVAARPALVEAGARVTLIYVQQPMPPRAAAVAGRDMLRAAYAAGAKSMLTAPARRLRDAGLMVHTTAPLGGAGDRIARAAVNGRADLVVMGSHGRGAAVNALLGSVAATVLSRCRTPVLLLRKGTAPARAALRVGIAYDGSAHGAAALDYALRHRSLFGSASSLRLAVVVDEVPIQVRTALANLTSTSFSHEQVRAQRQQAYDVAVAPARAALAAAGATTQIEMLVGSQPGDALAEWVRRERLDLLVMGSHGHTRLTNAVLGSVVMRTAARCDVPLLIVRP